MSFDNWRKRLAGETIKTFLQPQLEDEGYYRKPITEPVIGANGKTNGQKRIIGFEPVAYFIADGMLRGVIGDRDMAANEVTDEGLWSWVVKYPISEEWYRAVAERGERWPDFDAQGRWAPINLQDALKRTLAPAPAPVISHADNGEDESRERAEQNAEAPSIGHNTDNQPPVDPLTEHTELIDNAIRAAQDLEVKDENTAAIVLGAKNRLAELRLAADKAGHAIYDPLRKAYQDAQKPWPLIVAKADTMEKALNRKYLTWREAENKRVAEALAEQARLKREAEEKAERAADRAIANGEPPSLAEAPFEVEMPEPVAVPAAVTPTYRAAGQRTKAKEVEKWHIDGIDDYDAVYAVFKNNADVKAALLKAATAAITNGQEVPGTRRHFGLI